MLRAAIIAAFLVPASIAAQDDYKVWCRYEDQPEGTVCLWNSMPKTCADCLAPIEKSCPGNLNSSEFKDCFCPLPGKTFSAVEKCLNDPAAGCDSHGYLLNAYATACFRTGQEDFACDPAEQGKDPLVKTLSEYGMVCKDWTKKPQTSSIEVKTSAAPTSSKPAPTTTKPVVTVPSSVVQPSTSSKAIQSPSATVITPPIVTGGAVNLQRAGLNVAAVVVAGAAMNLV